MTDWIELLEASDAALRLRVPASQAEIQEAEDELGHPLPVELAHLLAATDGFDDVDAQYEASWSLARIVEENERIRREALMPWAGHRLCFGDNGAGEPFLHARTTNGWGPSVLVWGWIDEEARTLAPSLARFWQGWFDGTITT